MQDRAPLAADSGATASEGISPTRRAIRRLLRRKPAIFGLAVILIMVSLAVLAPLIAPYDPTALKYTALRKPPSLEHLFGTDKLGRDQFSRVLFGAQASLLAGVISVSVAILLGVPIGMIAGYLNGQGRLGNLADSLISRITDAMLACPFLILAIALASFLGPSLRNAMIAIGIAATPTFIRLARGQVLAVKAEDYVEAARAVGNPGTRVLLRHVLPNILPPVIVQASLAIAAGIIAEASLSFLGLGQQPPAPSWGKMLDDARELFEQAPWLALFPGLAIFLTVLSFNLLGDGLRDALDPREQR